MKAKALAVYLLILALGAGYISLFPRVSAATPELKAAQSLNDIRTERPKLMAFLKQMPKGGDLHSHLSGAVYAETFLRWAVEAKLCVDKDTLILSKAVETAQAKANKTQPLTPEGCEQGGIRLKQELAANDPVLYRRMIDAWSMRNWEHSGKSGHDQFFDSFEKFGEVTGRTGEMVAEVMKRAEASGVSYLELMLSLDGGKAWDFGSNIKWNGDYELTGNYGGALDELHKNTEYKPAIENGLQYVYDAEKQARAILKCNESEENPGCKVTVRYICQVARGGPRAQVFAQMLMAFEMADADAKRQNPRLVGINLVQPEDGMVAMDNFPVHMQMLNYLHSRYPAVNITLHAGELAPGLVPPDGLKFHIHDSVEEGHAKRIGHGVDIMQEDNAPALLREMADKGVMVEICLSSNDKILGVRGKDHPLAEYLRYGVPVALATDDEGVARSDMTLEYVKAAEEQGLSYQQLKMMARNSLQYAFISGERLWRNAKSSFEMVPQCSEADLTNTSSACQKFLDGSEKATLQWKLEKALKSFENQEGISN